MNLLEQEPQQTQSYRIIPLTKGQSAIVDATDYGWLTQWHWHAKWDKSTQSFKAARTARINKKCKTLLMSRQIMNTPSHMKCDHRNHDTLDNRRGNLRNCLNSENCRNRRRRADNTTGETGVQWRQDMRSWRVVVCVDGQRHQAHFKKLDDAIAARRKMAAGLHGEFYHP